MKKMLCILATTIVAAVVLSLFMTGCGNRGKIGNGENGTVTDNSSQATERSTNATDNNANNNGNNETASDNNNDNNLFDNNNNNNNSTIIDGTDNNNNNYDNNDNYEQTTENSSQQGVAGEIGDAIDEGVSDIASDIFGTEPNTEP